MSSTHSQLTPVRLTLLMCGAEIFSMTGFAAYTTLLPALDVLALRFPPGLHCSSRLLFTPETGA